MHEQRRPAHVDDHEGRSQQPDQRVFGFETQMPLKPQYRRRERLAPADAAVPEEAGLDGPDDGGQDLTIQVIEQIDE